MTMLHRSGHLGPSALSSDSGSDALDDSRELRQLVQARPDILKPLDRIEMQRADEAHITSGSNTWDDKHPRSTTFTARKKNGRWYIVPGTVDTFGVVITG